MVFPRRVKRADQTLPLPAVLALRCREITLPDLNGVIDLLTVYRAPREYWVGVIDRLTQHQTPEGFPKYGHMLENDGRPVGVLLQIFTARTIDGVTSIWCCGSSYYVDPRFRPYASVLLKRSTRYKGVTYLDLTSSPSRWSTLEAQGYKRIAQGVYLAIPALSRSRCKVRVHLMVPESTGRLDPSDADLLTRHASYAGCLALVCEHEGRLYPFIFATRRKYGLPFAYLIYSKHQSDFVKFSAAIGRYLVERGIPLAAFDADGPLAGIPGKMTKLRQRFWSGPVPPRLGDLAYTEIPMFGVI